MTSPHEDLAVTSSSAQDRPIYQFFLQKSQQQLYYHSDHHMLTMMLPWLKDTTCNTTPPIRLHAAPPGFHFCTCPSLQPPSWSKQALLRPHQPPAANTPLCILLQVSSQHPLSPKALLTNSGRVPEDAHGIAQYLAANHFVLCSHHPSRSPRNTYRSTIQLQVCFDTSKRTKQLLCSHLQ